MSTMSKRVIAMIGVIEMKGLWRGVLVVDEKHQYISNELYSTKEEAEKACQQWLDEMRRNDPTVTISRYN